MKTILFLSSLFFFSISLAAQESFMVKTETRYWDNSRTFDGYTLFGTRGTTYLIDFEGHVIHTWDLGTNPRFTGDGNLLDAVGGNPSNQNTWKELGWTGNVKWQYTESRTNYHGHHDFAKIYNPKLGDSTFIYIANKDLTNQQCLDAGCDAQYDYTGSQMDAIVEVNRQGTVVWEWWFFDHVVQDLYSAKPTYGIIANTPGRINLNIRGNHVKSDWMHCNSLDYNQTLDVIVINSVHGEFYVIDHGNTFLANNPSGSIALAATTAGDFKYRFGDPAKYNQGDPPSIEDNWEKATAGNKQLGGSHDIQWIRSGLPGAGNFMVFDNAQNLFELTPQSYVIEINPYLNSAGVNTGSFVNPPDAGYIVQGSPDANLMKENKNVSKQIVWKYSSKNNTSFYSTIGSSAQRLPNGNTFMCAMNDGHFFEIAPSDTSVVWEYTNPMTRNGIKKIKVDNYPTYNGVFRAYRYAADDPGLAGHDLTPGPTMTGDPPNYWTPDDLTVVENYGSSNPYNSLHQNYPNPFTTGTTIDFEITDPSTVDVIIYDFNGNKVKSLFHKTCHQGTYSIHWDGTDNKGMHVESGMYFYLLRSDTHILCKKMISIN
ncbi:MAG: aryl-sulfate sulfotransferase [Bacteroidetes bacterium]|nr:aryl-sulfate sulfotransferase [Bacteroidota bacterium]